ncbi:MAG: sulfotransferase domain-containing protein [Halofilum sp. (in: g-proteobacteria)]
MNTNAGHTRALLGRYGLAPDSRVAKLLRAPSSVESLIAVHSGIRRRLLARGDSILITCMPKSGSTFLLAALEEVTGYQQAKLIYSWARTDHELYLPRLLDAQFRHTVTRHHLRASGPNIELLERFRIKPVVLVRNLYDAAVSVRDHLEKEGHHNFPALHAPNEFSQMQRHEQLEFVIDHVMPWYIQFYASWYGPWIAGDMDMLWLRYEELIEDWSSGVLQVLEFYGLESNRAAITKAIEESYRSDLVTKRFNQVVVGRGLDELTEAQRKRIRKLASYHSGVDFSYVGL